MKSRVLTLALLVGIGGSGLTLLPKLSGFRLPGNQQFYEPVQPINFSHRLHAGELQIACLYCHWAGEKSRSAGVPAVSVCMNCHRQVTAPWGATRAEEELAKKEKRKPRRIVTPEIQRLYDALALNAQMQPDLLKSPQPIAWIKVQILPDFAYFDHRAHLNAGVPCQQCHGPVEQMERVRQVEDLSMGWCVNCHRRANREGIAGKPVQASMDCSTCHY